MPGIKTGSHRMIPLYNPPREDSKDVIDEMKNYSMEIKMLTGDNLAIALKICHLRINDRASRMALRGRRLGLRFILACL